MPEFAQETAESSDQTELLTLLSRQHDGDLNAAELQRLLVLESAHWDVAERFRRQAGKLSHLLQSIPVRAPERLIYESPAELVSLAAIVADREGFPRRSFSQRVVVSLVTSLLCAGLLFALIQRPDTSGLPILARSDVLQGPLEGRAGQALGGLGGAMQENGNTMAAPAPMAVAEDVPPHVSMGAAMANAKVAGGASVEDAPDSEMQPLIQSDDWNVVVVKVDGKDRDQAEDQIQSIVQKAGLRLKGTAGPDESRWFGVVLTSDVAGREDVVTAMEEVGESSGYVTETPPADSQEALFVAAARESLKHPTRSELHHGKVFVVLPSVSPVKAEKQMASRNELASGGANDDSLSPDLPEVLASPKASSAKSAKVVPAVTLVVFEFSEDEKSGPNNSGQQI